jgi:hypothetical protein
MQPPPAVEAHRDRGTSIGPGFAFFSGFLDSLENDQKRERAFSSVSDRFLHAICQ